QRKDARGEVAVQYSYYSSGDYTGLVENVISYGLTQLNYVYTTDSDGYATMTVTETDLINTSSPAKITVTTYDPRQNVLKTVDPLGNLWSNEYTDSLNPYLVTRATDPNLQHTDYTYDSQGNVKSVTDAYLNVTTLVYAQETESPLNPKHRNLVNQIIRPSILVGGVATNYSTYLYYDANGNLNQVKDAKNQSAYYAHRPDGRLSSVADRNGHITSFDYSPFSNGVSNLGNLTKITSPSGPNGAPAREVHFAYDLYDNLLSVTDALGHSISYQWDLNSRMTRTTDAYGKYVENTIVQGLLDHVTLPTNQGSSSNRRQTRFTYDDPGRVLQVLSSINATQEQMRVRYEYDSFDRVTKLARLKSGTEKSFLFEYDILDRQTSSKDPLLRETTTAYQPFCKSYTQTS
ncbi:unnamed protein product, partial [Phaeothamnion confervicola]